MTVQPPRPRTRAFTLLEMMVAVMVLAIIAAVVSPVISTTSDIYIQAMSVRSKSERVGFALERGVRLVREIPVAADGMSIAIRTAAADSLILEDNSGIQLDGSDLVMIDTTGRKSALCRNVTTFTLTYLASDGVTATTATPGLTRRVNITLKADGFTLSSAAFVRAGASL